MEELPPPPKRPPAGLGVVLLLFPNKEVAGVAPVPPPNSPPLAGAEVVGVLALFPNSPPVAGVVEVEP